MFYTVKVLLFKKELTIYNMRRVMYSLAIALLAISTMLCHAQQDLINKMMPKPVPASPNAAALGKFGDYQVSHFTGLPNISIPIFEAKSGELSIPITLNYHASGNRPTDVASWVGLGWSLSTGGQVTRSVNGKRDDEYYLTHPVNPAPNNCSSYHYLKDATSGLIDTEPDVYSYSYPGGSGKFMFPSITPYVNQNTTAPIGPAYLFPYAPIIVNRINDQKIEITDERGVLYRFGTNAGGTVSTEQTNAFNGGNPTVQAITAWNLMDIAAPNSNDAITFSYQALGTATRHDVTHTWLVTDECDSYNNTPCPTPTHGAAYSAASTDSNVNQQGVLEIFFATGKVKFIKSSAHRLDQAMDNLDKIEIYELFNGAYTKKKTVLFSYSYFTDASGGNAALKLNGIQFQDAADITVQNYTFEYHTNNFSWNGVTGNYLAARDYWKFYNGASGNTDLVKRQTVSYYSTVTSTPINIQIGGGFNRDVNTTYSKEGVLKRINFPTGGYTEFDYENHKYLNDQSVVTNSGGLRVTKITSSESATATPIVKTYKYGLAESGVGRALFSSNQLNYSAEQQYAGPICDGVNNPGLTYRIRTYHSSSFDIDESSPVVYGYVTEYLGDPTGAINGKTIYEYDANVSWADLDQTVVPSSKVFRNSYAWKRGKLTKKTIFDGLNNKLAEAATIYSTVNQQDIFVGLGTYLYRIGDGWGCVDFGYCTNEVGEFVYGDMFRASPYRQNSGVMMPTTSIESTFENGAVGNVVTKTTYTDYHSTKLQPTKVRTTTSNSNQALIVRNLYPFHYYPPSSSTGNALGIYMLNSKNILTTPVQTSTYLSVGSDTLGNITSSRITSYKANPNNSSHVVPDQVYLWESEVPMSPYYGSFKMVINGTNSGITVDARFKPRLKFSSYDAWSSIIQFSKIGDVPTSFQYGYGGKLPVAEIKNAQNSSGLVEFRVEGFEDLSGTNIIDNAANAHSGRKYYNGDYTILFTPPNSRKYVIEYYYYSAPNWIYIKKDYTGPSMPLAEGTRIDNIRIRPADAMLTSYTYHPLFGISSVTDPNGVTTFYEYDTFGRLQLIKDHDRNVMSTYNYHYYKQQ